MTKDEIVEKVKDLLKAFESEDMEEVSNLSAFFGACQCVLDERMTDAVLGENTREDRAVDNAKIQTFAHCLLVDWIEMDTETLVEGFTAIGKKLVGKMTMELVDGPVLVSVLVAQVAALVTTIENEKRQDDDLNKMTYFGIQLRDAISKAILDTIKKHDPAVGESN